MSGARNAAPAAACCLPSAKDDSMSNVTPEATTKFKIWGQRWYVLKVSGEAARKSKLLFSVAEEHPEWLCWYSFDEALSDDVARETFSQDAMHRSTGDLDDGPGGDGGMILRKAESETLGVHSLIQHRFTVSSAITVAELGHPYRRPGRQLDGGNLGWISAMEETRASEGVKCALAIKLESGMCHTVLSMKKAVLGDLPQRKTLKGYIWPLLVEPFSLHQLHNTKRFVPKLLER
jgi:hypothetical protein